MSVPEETDHIILCQKLNLAETYIIKQSNLVETYIIKQSNLAETYIIKQSNSALRVNFMNRTTAR